MGDNLPQVYDTVEVTNGICEGGIGTVEWITVAEDEDEPTYYVELRDFIIHGRHLYRSGMFTKRSLRVVEEDE